MRDETWFNETNKQRITWDGEGYATHKWLSEYKWSETLPYIDKYDNTTVNATISVTEREWRPRAFMWTSLFSRSKRQIDIEFDKEVGRKKGSYKGGCLGCSYELKAGETPAQCLKRMEQERKF